jgi:PIN like domain
VADERRCHQPALLVDENVLGLGKVLEIARRDVVHPGHKLLPEVPTGALDTAWIPTVAAKGLAVISRDQRIRIKQAELVLLKQHGLRVFWIAGKASLSTWGYLTRIVRRWGDIENILATRGGGPWFFEVHDRIVSEIRV